jgi:hypothetical protein
MKSHQQVADGFFVLWQQICKRWIIRDHSCARTDFDVMVGNSAGGLAVRLVCKNKRRKA